MTSKIIFLGTAGDDYVVGKQLRASGGIIIESDDIQLHIDPGPGSLVRAQQYGVNLRANTVILVSSSDVKNCGDLNAVVDATTHSGLDKKGVLIINNTIINGHENMIPVLTKHHRECMERIIVLEKGKRVGIEDIEIHAIPCHSEDPNAVGFRIITPYSVIVYSGDTDYSPNLANHYKDADILILNVQSPSTSKDKGGLCSSDAGKILEKAKPRLAVINHFGVKMLRSDPIYEARMIQKETNIQTIAAKDGMIINPVSFSSKIRQSSLKKFGSPSVESSEKVSTKVTEIGEIVPGEEVVDEGGWEEVVQTKEEEKEVVEQPVDAEESPSAEEEPAEEEEKQKSFDDYDTDEEATESEEE